MTDPFYITLASALAIHLGENLLDATTRRVREKFSGDARNKALTNSLREGLENAFAVFHLEDVEQDHFSTLFETFLGEEDVVDEFTHLIDPRPNTSLNLELLRGNFNALGFDDKTLAIFSFDLFIQQFGESFYSAAAKQTELQGAIEIGLLRKTVDQLGSISTYTERTAIAVEQTAEATDKISLLIEEFLQGHNNKLSTFIEETKGFGQIFVLLERIISLLSKSGYDITINDVNNGNVIIGDSNQVGGVTKYAIVELQAEINRLRQDVISHEPSEEELQIIEKRYRQHIITWFEHLTFQGMMRTAKPISLPLEEVYVELRAVGEVPEAADTFSVEERRLMLEIEDKDESAKQELLHHMDTLRRERWSHANIERKSISETLFKQDELAFVILGDPGSGKSTLLHLLALVYARGSEAIQKQLKAPVQELNRLPIFVPLAAFDDMLRTHPGMTLLEFLPKYFDRRRLIIGLAPLFQRALQSGNALVLFDGLDEVLDATTRRYVANQVTIMINEYTPLGVRFAMTSRFIGYREAPIGGDIPHLSVMDFGKEEIKTFVRKWSHVYETWVQGGKESLESTRSAHQKEKDLLDDVESNTSVRRLAANPLMLTMLALLRRHLGKLPHRRIELYKRYMDTMIDNWVEARTVGERENKIKISDPHQAESLLIPLAYWLQSSQPSGTASKAVIQNAVTEICLRDEGLDPATALRQQRKEAEEHARKFLEEMRNMSGLIVERGNDAFGFLHLTFQEYFAGRALAQIKAEDRWHEVSPHLHDPRWREPILLCAGQLGIVEKRRADVSDFVRNILNHENPTENDLHQNLLLALSIAGDDVNLEPGLINEIVNRAVECLPTKVYAFASELITRLGQLVANGATQTEICFSKVWGAQDSQLHRTGIQALKIHFGDDNIRNQIITHLDDPDSNVRSTAIDALASLISAPQVYEQIIKHLDDPDNNVRSTAIDALGSLISDPQVREQILKRLDDPDRNVNHSAVKALASLVASDAQVRERILKLLDNPNWLVRYYTVRDIASFVISDAQIREQILKRLDDPDRNVSYSAVKALVPLVPSDHQVREKILKRLDDPDDNVRSYTVSALAPLVASDTQIREQILSLLNDPDSNVRGSAVDALALLVASDAQIREQILSLLNDPDSNVRGSAVYALAPLVASDTQVREQIENQIAERSWQIRKTTVDILGQSLHHPQLVTSITKLLNDSLDILSVTHENLYIYKTLPLITSNSQIHEQILKRLDDTDVNVRSSIVSALGSLVASDAQIREQILKRLDDPDNNVRGSAVSALASLVISNTEVREQILKRLDDLDKNVSSSAVRALAPLVASNAQVREQIIKRLDDPDDNVRSSTVNALASLVASDAQIREQILKRLDDPDDNVRSSTIRALTSIVISDTQVREQIIKYLNQPDDNLRSSAISALAALVSSDAQIREQIIKNLDDPNWAMRYYTVKALAPYVTSDTQIRDKILKHINDSDVNVRISVVSALASLVTSNTQVREQILKLLDDPDENVRYSAVSVLTSLVKSDTQVREQILKCLDDQNWQVRKTTLEALYQNALESMVIGVDTIKDFVLSEVDELYSVSNKSSEYKKIEMRKFLTGQLTEEYLLSLLENPSWMIRLDATLLLLARNEKPPREIINRIINSMDDDRGMESFPARLSAASFLINRDKYSTRAIQVCLDALEYGTGKWDYLPRSGDIRQQAALILGTLEPIRYDQKVYDQLYKSMSSDDNPEVRDTAYTALIKLARAREFKQ